ncbi:hypothetical protein QVD17_01373 [Tagetes erecta]|uniref:Uncharacterized protein n=1 Tax=Tagetes erecta TaxID=13708 RepID=A0AAD8L697_TARER|nr:hypothetical protein QVD17_01373 [Tagetes erecta]
MGSLIACLKPICLLGNNKKKEDEKGQRTLHKEGNKERVLMKNKLTLQDYILSSPRSSPFGVTNNKRVHPNPPVVNERVTSERLLLGARIEGGEGDQLKTKMDDDLPSKGERRKKRVSFRMPEVADVFILGGSPTTVHESTDSQVHDHQ